MSKLDEARQQAELRLQQSRRQAEARLAEVRSAVEAEVGRAPRKVSLLLVVLAGEGGRVSGFQPRRRRRA